ncbi:mechanosensitive ion channel family protein [Reichenbachiella agarivorans]|uniref:Mechanosensitive ion channel family protein n=1 Tax=Reichenbachiella agarivorans TaxID=2979464 RepID=A0ABY6CMK7_9BACT|nr:mechanosensitive ion channel family protein [Reichenbachiella agarivorans]UXP31736.1 mechanosensitive ion channel family protein [Reichenbachiella agarivorans]
MKEIFSQEFWQETYSTLAQWIIQTIPSILLIIILLFVSLKLYRRVIKSIERAMLKAAQLRQGEESLLEKEKRVNTLVNIIRQAGKIVIWAIFLLILLRKIDIDIAPILASAGILGLAVGFGAQELVRDFISGFFILFENQVRTGDVAIINGTGGLVEEIALRTITLRDFAGVVHIFQNGKINTLSNMTKEWSASVFDIGVAYKEDIGKVRMILHQVGAELQEDPAFKNKINEPLEVFGLDKFGDSAVVIKARFKTKPSEQWNVGREFNERLKKAFDTAGIEIPFPHRTVYWGDAINPLMLKLDEESKLNAKS